MGADAAIVRVGVASRGVECEEEDEVQAGLLVARRRRSLGSTRRLGTLVLLRSIEVR
jgi:hypothetical protein